MTMSPFLTSIVNASLSNAEMPKLMKEAMINPILKKPHLDKDTLNNYRSVSNLPYVSKLIERVVAKQLQLVPLGLYHPFLADFSANFAPRDTILTSMSVNKKVLPGADVLGCDTIINTYKKQLCRIPMAVAIEEVHAVNPYQPRRRSLDTFPC